MDAGVQTMDAVKGRSVIWRDWSRGFCPVLPDERVPA